MKRATKIAVAVGLALGLGTAVVVAQPYGWGGGMMGGRMMGGGPGMMSGGPGMMGGGPGMMGGGGYGYNIEDRLTAQKSALKITPEQEDAWKAYADIAKKQADVMFAQHEAMWKSAPSSSAERYELHSKFMAQRAEQHEALSTAYKGLYAVLTPEQRALADQRGGFGYGPRGPGAGWR
jgi:Spy/CpxP family protein refolding chaperone